MIAKGEKLIVWDSTLQDMYTATAAQEETDERNVNPLARICGVIYYPIQHAAMFPDQPSEHAPLPEGTECRLKLICCGTWLCFDGDYSASLAAAREQLKQTLMDRLARGGNRLDSVMLASARAQLEAIHRHEQGKYPTRMVMGRDRPFTARWPEKPIQP